MNLNDEELSDNGVNEYADMITQNLSDFIFANIENDFRDTLNEMRVSSNPSEVEYRSSKISFVTIR